MSLWISKGEKQKELELRLYAPESEVIRLTFNPLKISDEPNWNPQWEEWTCYATPLVIYKQDYEIMLKYYLTKCIRQKMLLTELLSHVLMFVLIIGLELTIG